MLELPDASLFGCSELHGVGAVRTNKRVNKELAFPTTTQGIILQGAHSINSLSLLAC